MAITAIEYTLIGELKKAGLLPTQPHILELGEANWYGDVPIDQLIGDIPKYVGEKERCKQLADEIQHIMVARSKSAPFDIAKIFYQVYFQYRSITSIDFHGTEAALRQDLNRPLELERQFEFVINGGTAEHIFNVCQFFQTVHAATKPGGLMFHGTPFTGWLDHGFYGFNPTFYYDLAAQNEYGLLGLVYAELKPLKLVQIQKREQIAEMANGGQLGANSLLYAVLRKPEQEQAFNIPMQGYYAGTVSAEVRDAWRTLR